MMLPLVLEFFLLMIISANGDNCLGKNRVTSGCGPVVVYAKFEKAVNFTVTLDGAAYGHLTMTIGGDKMDCSVDAFVLSCPQPYISPVSFYVSTGAINISSLTKTDSRAGSVEVLGTDEDRYLKMEIGFRMDSGLITVTLENGDFMRELPAKEENSGFDDYAIAGIVAGCFVAFVVVLAVIWAVSVRTCCKERWTSRKRCRRGHNRNRVLPAKCTSAPLAKTQPRQKSERKRAAPTNGGSTSHQLSKKRPIAEAEPQQSQAKARSTKPSAEVRAKSAKMIKTAKKQPTKEVGPEEKLADSVVKDPTLPDTTEVLVMETGIEPTVESKIQLTEVDAPMVEDEPVSDSESGGKLTKATESVTEDMEPAKKNLKAEK